VTPNEKEVRRVEPEHVHEWQPVGVVKEREDAYSPVSVYDHQFREVSVAVRSCTCGAVRRTIVSYGPWKWLNR
jgi:hypothetical protein